MKKIIWALATAWILMATADLLAAGEGPKNLLFILMDDQRFDTVQALGNPEVITPQVDTLVKEGLTFSNAYINGGNAATKKRVGL